MNALTRLVAFLPFAIGAAAFSFGCGGAVDGAGGGDGNDAGTCTGTAPACGTTCGTPGSATCTNGAWSCGVVNGIECPYPPTDGGIETDASASCGDVQPDCSFTDCDGTPISVSPSCNDGTWECPLYNGIACEGDAGTGDDDAASGCSTPAPSCTETGCNGQTITTSATCSNGEWQCVALPIACIEDAGPPSPPVDAGPAPDAGNECSTAAPVCIGRDCNGNATTYQPTCEDFGWACIEPPLDCLSH